MTAPMKIVMVASECVPFVKTGGLADVVGALPKALKKMGHEVSIILPKYSKINTDKFGLKRLQDSMGVWMGSGHQEWASVDYCLIDDDIPVYFIESWQHFGRQGIYNDNNNKAFEDNIYRYSFFSRAAIQLCIDRKMSPDIIHVHDWQTALIPAYLKTWHWHDPNLRNTASVLTIHNIDYQGVSPKSAYEYVGLDWAHFSYNKFEDHDNINLLKGGIFFADLVNTVSPTYAHETKFTALGRGMQVSLQQKGQSYLGILNGVDYDDWNPATDKLIPANYTAQDLAGKAECKAALQELFQLEVNPNIPLFGVVSRFANQKGLEVLYESIHQVMHRMFAQFVVLGSGDKTLEWKYMQLPTIYPRRVGSFIGYDNRRAHWIEAGSDFFVMPSHFEPCGLNQLYSLKYGTIPIVRNTGGLADTVVQYNEDEGAGTGYKYQDNHPQALTDTIGWAVSTFFDRREHHDRMMQNGMQQLFDWDNSAQKYVLAYAKARAIKRGY